MNYTEKKKGLSGVILLLLIVLSGFVSAQNATLRGRLIDEVGEAVPFALVIVGEGEYSTMTDLDGAFNLDVPAGRYKVTGMQGGLKVEVEVVALAGQVKVLGDLTLKATAEKMEEVVITVTGAVKSAGAVQR